MESKTIYEESHDELVRLKKCIGSDTFEINVSKLDGETKNALLTAINNVIYSRCQAIEKVILGVQ